MLSQKLNQSVGVVIIGRNEGERFKSCLRSVLAIANQVIYVDSGSTDDSVEFARAQGCHTLQLDMQVPFTAARARNSGFRKLFELYPQLEYIQFLDGDCDLDPNWLKTALGFMAKNTDCAVVCGRRCEKFPDASIYNKLCDIEWDTPVGEADACGGDALFRTPDLIDSGGYRDAQIAGEEPELCYRLRTGGRKIYRLEHDMTYHDAAMHSFKQWAKRSQRAGFAYASVFWLHGRTGPEYFWKKDTLSIIAWAIVLPLLIFTLVLFNPIPYLLIAIYPLQIVRLALTSALTSPTNWQWAGYIVLGKFFQAVGVIQFFMTMNHKQHLLIEYK